MPESSPAAWYPDPFGRHELRYWDGSSWTGDVATGGRQAVDPAVDTPRAVVSPQAPAAWYPDPDGRHERRYWDGSSWTGHVSTGGRQVADPPVDTAKPAVTPQAPVGWYPDPYGEHERRYWDGSQWTDHVTSREPQEVDPPAEVVPAPPVHRLSKKVARQARNVAAVVDGDVGGSPLFTEPVLVVNQTAKFFGSTVGYAVYDRNGRQLGMVQEIGRDFNTKMGDRLRLRGDTTRRYRLQLVDTNNRVLLAMTRPETRWKSSVVVDGPGGTAIGRIVQETLGVWGGVRFGLDGSDGQRLGAIKAENWEGWDFKIGDAAGTEIARITKTWAGWAKERFTKADNYVVQIHHPLEEPLRSLVIAAAVVVDVVLKQGDQVSGTRRHRRYE